MFSLFHCDAHILIYLFSCFYFSLRVCIHLWDTEQDCSFNDFLYLHSDSVTQLTWVPSDFWTLSDSPRWFQRPKKPLLMQQHDISFHNNKQSLCALLPTWLEKPNHNGLKKFWNPLKLYLCRVVLLLLQKKTVLWRYTNVECHWGKLKSGCDSNPERITLWSMKGKEHRKIPFTQHTLKPKTCT